MLIDLGTHMRTPMQRRLYQMVGPWVETTFGLRGLEGVYQRSRELYIHHHDGPTCFAWFDSVLNSIDVTTSVVEPPDFQFPKSGPLIIVANHPYGILDPCVLARYAAAQRPDLKVMTNSQLTAMPELVPHIIAVDPFGGEGAAKSNVRAMKEALRHLRAGGALLIFPAGEVAAYKPGRGVEEAPWSNHVGSLVRRTQASVLPVFFPGRNGLLFHAAGLVHPRLRTGLLLREFQNQHGLSPEMRVGMPMPFAKLRKFDDDESLTRYLRLHTLILGNRRKAAAAAQDAWMMPLSATAESHHGRIAEEVANLRDRGQCLASLGGLSVFAAHCHDIPETLQEIGHLRERTFREAGEGTGEPVDLDRFDSYYEHLFLWDEERQRIAGAYRLGRADVILREYGLKGLYTSTLFRFEKPFLAHLERAVEMGRSFIIKEYQRNLSSLPLLWKGIAQWMSRNPGYKKLFGPVSISKDYDSLSRKMMVEFLQGNCLHEDLASFVKPRNPFRYLRSRRLMREFISADLRDVDDCSALISSVELDRKGIPILLKHYLRLSGTILSFNVDKNFSSVIDGLILVD
ncbi:MAG: GNAT family N-acyltransferase, partial [Prosthecobacter sp.]|nr:GNAT family N-acyltransferase [Prosthecobacter sp.]